MGAGFKYRPRRDRRHRSHLTLFAGQKQQMTGLVGADGVTPVPTTIWGYGTHRKRVSWPGMTIEWDVNDDPLHIRWKNKLVDKRGRPLPHLFPVDTNLHWAYTLHGYENNSIEKNGVPLAPPMFMAGGMTALQMGILNTFFRLITESAGHAG